MAAINPFFFFLNFGIKRKKEKSVFKKKKTFKEIETQIPNVLRAWGF